MPTSRPTVRVVSFSVLMLKLGQHPSQREVIERQARDASCHGERFVPPVLLNGLYRQRHDRIVAGVRSREIENGIAPHFLLGMEDSLLDDFFVQPHVIPFQRYANVTISSSMIALDGFRLNPPAGADRWTGDICPIYRLTSARRPLGFRWERAENNPSMPIVLGHFLQREFSVIEHSEYGSLRQHDGAIGFAEFAGLPACRLHQVDHNAAESFLRFFRQRRNRE